MTRTLTGFVVGLVITGGLAIAGLAVPVARDYLGGVVLTPGGADVTLTSAPMIRTSYAGPEDKATWLSPHGRLVRPLLVDPDCQPPQGWV